jgi:hypothetical protein
MPGFEYTAEYTTKTTRTRPGHEGFENMGWLTSHLTEMGQQGWRLHTIFEHGANTVVIFERTTP